MDDVVKKEELALFKGVSWLVAGFPPRRPGFDPVSGQVGFVVDKVALGRIFSEYFGFPCQSSIHQILHHHNHPGQATIGQLVAAVPSGPSWTPPPTKRKECVLFHCAQELRYKKWMCCKLLNWNCFKGFYFLLYVPSTHLMVVRWAQTRGGIRENVD
jgi:hypothetical protein